METIVRLTHFPKQAQGQDKKPKTLEVALTPASINPKGWPEEGTLLLSLDDNEKRIPFQLPATEAALLMKRLEYGLGLLSEQYRAISGTKPKPAGPK